jgi:hypothetical protein
MLSRGKYGSLQSESTATTLVSTTSSLYAKQLHLLCISNTLPDFAESIWIKTFSYLDAISLCTCQRVCKSFIEPSLNTELWKSHCKKKRLDYNLGRKSDNMLDTNNGRWWKEIYVEGVVTRRNWILGRHKKRLIEILPDQKDIITWYLYLSII